MVLKFLSFVCDALAREFLKSIKIHNRYWHCKRCEVKGFTRITFIAFHIMDSIPRANIFNNNGYAGKHQVQRSCLTRYGTNCENNFKFGYVYPALFGAEKH